jgi:hypothetical protein
VVQLLSCCLDGCFVVSNCGLVWSRFCLCCCHVVVVAFVLLFCCVASCCVVAGLAVLLVLLQLLVCAGLLVFGLVVQIGLLVCAGGGLSVWSGPLALFAGLVITMMIRVWFGFACWFGLAPWFGLLVWLASCWFGHGLACWWWFCLVWFGCGDLIVLRRLGPVGGGLGLELIKTCGQVGIQSVNRSVFPPPIDPQLIWTREL